MGSIQYHEVEKIVYMKNEKFLLRLMWRVRRRCAEMIECYVASHLENGHWSKSAIASITNVELRLNQTMNLLVHRVVRFGLQMEWVWMVMCIRYVRYTKASNVFSLNYTSFQRYTAVVVIGFWNTYANGSDTYHNFPREPSRKFAYM